MKIKKINFAMPYLMIDGLDPKTMMAMFEAFPRDFKIVTWGHSHDSYVAYWIIKSDEFEDIPTGHCTPELTLNFEKDGDYLKCWLE